MALVLLVNRRAGRILCQEKNLDKNKKPMLVSRRIFEGRNLVSEYAVEVEAPFSRNARFAKKAETF